MIKLVKSVAVKVPIMKKIGTINNDEELDEALDQIEQLWRVTDDQESAIYMDHLVEIVRAYEEIHYPIDPPIFEHPEDY